MKNMRATVCRQCGNVIEKTPEIPAGVCRTCERAVNSEPKLLETAQQVFLYFGYIALGMFIPLLLLPAIKGPNASGYYVMSGKTTAIFSFTGLVVLNVLNSIALLTFFGLHFYFKRKLRAGRR